jgi:hypothetical protein
LIYVEKQVVQTDVELYLHAASLLLLPPPMRPPVHMAFAINIRVPQGLEKEHCRMWPYRCLPPTTTNGCAAEIHSRCTQIPDLLHGARQRHRDLQQLISAVGFYQARGIFHHGLQPGSLLVDERGDLKVSDMSVVSYFLL